MPVHNVKENGVIGSIYTAGSNVVTLEIGGTLDGASIILYKYMGEGRTANPNDPLFEIAVNLDSVSMGANGVRYTVGTDNQYVVKAAGGGASLDANVAIQELVGNPN